MAGESKSSTQRRQRIQLSCQPCRIGKLKCSRELPCEQCTKRSRETSCVYTPGAQESISFKTQAKAMREKLENLERAVQHFKEADQRRAEHSGQFGIPGEMPPTDIGGDSSSPAMDLSTSPGSHPTPITPGHLINSSEEGNAYVGPSHWQSIINDIAEVKACFQFEAGHESGLAGPEEGHSASSPGPSNTPDLFLRISPSISKETLIQSVPPQPIADRLLAAYFGSMDLYKPLIHLPTFQKQYHQFYQRPESAPTTWLALLLTIFALGFQYSMQTHGDKDPAYDSNAYLELAAHAIALSDYTKPKAYTIEGLILYIRCCQMQESERQFKDWLALGLVSRICIRLGYHRDPSHYPEISAFDGEMRRRVWLFVCFLDATMSYSIGLISNIATNVHSNVRLPRNLHDSDFGFASAEIPPSRPSTDITGITHMIHAGRLVPFFAESVRLSHSPVAPNIQDVYAIASRLQQVAEDIPPALVVVSPEEVLTDSPSMIIKRYGLELLVQKSRCILFRRYLGSTELKARKACVEAAMRILEIQKCLETARLPGSPLYNTPAQQFWDLLDTFLLGGIIVASEISAGQRQAPDDPSAPYTRDELRSMSHALRTTCSVWQASTIASEKAKRAAKALQSVLQPKGAPRGVGGEPDFPDASLMDPGQAHGVDMQSQWFKASADPMQAFDVNSLTLGGIAPYPPVSGSPPMQMDYSLQTPMTIDWVSSRIPYFG